MTKDLSEATNLILSMSNQSEVETNSQWVSFQKKEIQQQNLYPKKTWLKKQQKLLSKFSRQTIKKYKFSLIRLQTTIRSNQNQINL